MSITTDYFTFDGVASTTFGVYLFEDDTFSSPEKEYETATVPGRSGDLLLSGHRFRNVEHVYDAIIPTDFETNFANLRAFLLSRNGYCRLSDTIHTDEFYQAYFSAAVTPTKTRDRSMGKFKLVFNRKPQRFLTSGETATTMNTSTNSITLNNPTRFPCYPLIKIWGTEVNRNFAVEAGKCIYFNFYTYSGTGDYYLNTSTESRPLCIDMETLQSYIVLNSMVTYYYNGAIKYTAPTGDLAKSAFMLLSGNNTVAKTAGNMNMSIIPRWYTL